MPDARVNRLMRIQTIQIVAGLLAAVAFVIAFISAGVAVISFAFALIGAVALAWLATYAVSREVWIAVRETLVTRLGLRFDEPERDDEGHVDEQTRTRKESP